MFCRKAHVFSRRSLLCCPAQPVCDLAHEAQLGYLLGMAPLPPQRPQGYGLCKLIEAPFPWHVGHSTESASTTTTPFPRQQLQARRLKGCMPRPLQKAQGRMNCSSAAMTTLPRPAHTWQRANGESSPNGSLPLPRQKAHVKSVSAGIGLPCVVTQACGRYSLSCLRISFLLSICWSVLATAALGMSME